MTTTIRKCCTCKQIKPIESFNFNRARATGRNYQCRECNKAYLYTYRRANAEKSMRHVRGNRMLLSRKRLAKPPAMLSAAANW